jgi:acetoacetyl-CoA synthetase
LKSSATAIVARAWREVLDAPSFGENIPFDQAGGDSLQLLKLIFLIEEAAGVRLPKEACQSCLRPSALVRLVRSAHLANALLETEPPGTVFLIPGLGGETPLVGGFRAACSPALRVVTADLPDWPEMIEPNFVMDDLIGRIAAEIAARASAGAIRLAGYSFGGHIAFGVARALASAGREIAFLGILDTDTVTRQPVTPRGRAAMRALRRIRWGAHNLQRAWRRGATADWIGEVTADFIARKDRRLGLAVRMRRLWLPASCGMFVNIYLREKLQARMLRVWQASPSYRQMQLDAPVVLFRSEEHPGGAPPDLGWREFCPRLHVINVPGGHKNMLRMPSVGELSARFIRAAEVATAEHA